MSRISGDDEDAFPDCSQLDGQATAEESINDRQGQGCHVSQDNTDLRIQTCAEGQVNKHYTVVSQHIG